MIDRGQALLIGLAAGLVAVCCSHDQRGGGGSGTAGDGVAGQGGSSGSGGTGTTTGGTTGIGGTNASAGRGGAAGTAIGGMGGTGGFGGSDTGGGGTGGLGGSSLPACPIGKPTFSVCAVNDADVLPFVPPLSGSGGAGGEYIQAAAATVEAVGTGPAPARCQEARIFGAAASSDWWLQVRTADTKLWTIGLGGLGSVPFVQTGDAVKLDLLFHITPAGSFTASHQVGYVQVSDAAGTPLLWAGSDSYASGTWLALGRGPVVCSDMPVGLSCRYNRYEVMATINGSTANIMPFTTLSVGGYDLSVGEYDDPGTPITQTGCAAAGPPAFANAAVKVR